MKKELIQNLKRLIGQKLNLIKFACQMVMLDYGKYAIHFQALTRISKNDDILFTTFDYQNWDFKDFGIQKTVFNYVSQIKKNFKFVTHNFVFVV